MYFGFIAILGFADIDGAYHAREDSRLLQATRSSPPSSNQLLHEIHGADVLCMCRAEESMLIGERKLDQKDVLTCPISNLLHEPKALRKTDGVARDCRRLFLGSQSTGTKSA